MSLDLSLDNKKIVIMGAAFCVLFILAFVGGWILGAKRTQTKGVKPPTGVDQPKPKAAQSSAAAPPDVLKKEAAALSKGQPAADTANKKEPPAPAGLLVQGAAPIENQKSDLAQKKADLEQKIPLAGLQKKAPPAQTGEKVPAADQKPAGDKAAAKTDATPEKAKPEEEAQEEVPIVYSVQVGSFVAKIKADHMVAQLKARGQAAVILNQQDSRGRRWYTVQIGDFADYDVAWQTAKKFTKKKKIVAVVQPVDMFALKAMKAEPPTEEETETSTAKKEETPPQEKAQDTPQAQNGSQQ